MQLTNTSPHFGPALNPKALLGLNASESHFVQSVCKGMIKEKWSVATFKLSSINAMKIVQDVKVTFTGKFASFGNNNNSFVSACGGIRTDLKVGVNSFTFPCWLRAYWEGADFSGLYP